MSEKEILSSTAPGAEEVQGLPVANASALDAGADAEGGDGDSAVNAGAENDADAEGEEDEGAHAAGEDGKVEEDTNMDETDEERKQRACRQSMFITIFSLRFLLLFSLLLSGCVHCTVPCYYDIYTDALFLSLLHIWVHTVEFYFSDSNLPYDKYVL